jgi:hypothetical protein
LQVTFWFVLSQLYFHIWWTYMTSIQSAWGVLMSRRVVVWWRSFCCCHYIPALNMPTIRHYYNLVICNFFVHLILFWFYHFYTHNILATFYVITVSQNFLQWILRIILNRLQFLSRLFRNWLSRGINPWLLSQRAWSNTCPEDICLICIWRRKPRCFIIRLFRFFKLSGMFMQNLTSF